MDPKFIKKLKNDIQKSEDLISKLTQKRDEINEQIKFEQGKKRNAESTLSSFEKIMEQARKIENGYSVPKADKKSKEKDVKEVEEQEEVFEETEDVEDTDEVEENENVDEDIQEDEESNEYNDYQENYEEDNHEDYQQEEQDYNHQEDENNRHRFGGGFF